MEKTYTLYARYSGVKRWQEFKKGITAEYVVDAIKYYLRCDETKGYKWDYKIVPE